MSFIVYRIQDCDGRGPWKPGFSDSWIDDSRSLEEIQALKPWMEEFGYWPLRCLRPNTHFGCACRSLDQLRRWFTPTEYATLSRLGYRAVRMKADRILAQSEIQCVFERSQPLRKNVQAVELYLMDEALSA